jgi:prepilin-type N-terminal cleavage/methylation domain-containing protein
MTTLPSSPSRPARGFTMAEMMVALAIGALTMAGVVAFTHQALNGYACDSGIMIRKAVNTYNFTVSPRG